MKHVNKCLFAGVAAIFLTGCIVREEPPRRHYYVQEAPPPLVEAPPPGYVEVVPAAPGPEFFWAPGVYVYDEHGHRYWRHGYYHHR